MKKIIYSSITLLALLIQACIPKPLDVELEMQKPKLVISSLIIPNSVMLVSISKSFSSLNNPSNGAGGDSTFYQNFIVEHALVTVAYAGRIDTLRAVGGGVYASLNTLQISNEVYHLYAKDSVTGEEVIAESRMMPQVKFDEVAPYIVRTAEDTTVKIKYKFTDIPNEENYYMVNYSSRSTSLSVAINSKVIGGGQFSANDLFTDVDKDKDGFIKVDQTLNIPQHDTLYMQLVHISRGFYDFMNAYQRSGKLINQATGQPINFPTNVTGGYGYFNTHYPDPYIFDLNKY
ncbi:MAG: DUF4249 domain-containing protein [Bacteroidetes bacterium]|nr:DUF4249 domain-containing protein [Bacteroidota bacterium]